VTESDQAKNWSARSGGAPRNIHISAIRSRCPTEGSGRSARGPIAPTRPPVGADTEELVELDVTVGELEDAPEGVEEAIDADVITCPLERPAQVEHHSVREQRRQVSRSSSKIALVIRLTVVTFECSRIVSPFGTIAVALGRYVADADPTSGG
jgi:hypothetical protein